ncbi:hypothetical protein ACTWPT_24555 [Nonomuraea sp. 3N208]|uniref:hypothetical protein n=1 Tax=Nonomuraea sp. 3N208 TaxID=3457421 RepID=UPI003FD07C20
MDETSRTRNVVHAYVDNAELSGRGLISRITDYWPEPYEPPPGREHLVERL